MDVNRKKQNKNSNFLDSYGEKEIFSMSGKFSSIDQGNSKYERILQDEPILSSGKNRKMNYNKSNSNKYNDQSGMTNSKVKINSSKIIVWMMTL